jgi:hypothetical protein
MSNPNIAAGGSNRHPGSPLKSSNIPSNCDGLASGAMNAKSVGSTSLKGQPSLAIKQLTVKFESLYSKPYSIKTQKTGLNYDY